MRPVYLYDDKAKMYPLPVGQDLYMSLLPLPIRVIFDLPVGTIDAALHIHIIWYLDDFPESFIYYREQLTLGSVLYTIQGNKHIRYYRLPSRSGKPKIVHEIIENLHSTLSWKMLVRAIGTSGTEVGIETFLWDDDHEPTDDEISMAFIGHDLVSACLKHPVYEHEAFEGVFRSTSVKPSFAGDQKPISPKSSKNKGGRPSYEEDNWAWDEVNLKGRPREEVYTEWLEKKQPKRRLLSDPERAFRNAISLKRRGKPA